MEEKWLLVKTPRGIRTHLAEDYPSKVRRCACGLEVLPTDSPTRVSGPKDKHANEVTCHSCRVSKKFSRFVRLFASSSQLSSESGQKKITEQPKPKIAVRSLPKATLKLTLQLPLPTDRLKETLEAYARDVVKDLRASHKEVEFCGAEIEW